MTEKTGKFSALLSTIEVGLGSWLHALHIPFVGHILSIHQGLLLTWCVRSEKKNVATKLSRSVSIVSSILKSLSPVGKKLTPMLAILVQGFLYSLGIQIFGVNLLGVSAGMAFLSVWAFIQPLLIAYLILGQDLLETLLNYFSISTDQVFYILILAVLVKVIAAVIVGIFGYKISEHKKNRYFDHMKTLSTLPKTNPSTKSTNADGFLKSFLRELFHPMVLVGLVLAGLFFGLQKDHSIHTFWVFILRPLAVSWLIFWGARMIALRLKKKLPQFFEKFPTLSESVTIATQELNKKHDQIF